MDSKEGQDTYLCLKNRISRDFSGITRENLESREEILQGSQKLFLMCNKEEMIAASTNR